MGTDIRPELSNKNKYWISRHRYYELKHFCLQYSFWKKEYAELGDNASSGLIIKASSNNTQITDEGFVKRVAKRVHYSNMIEMVEKAAKDASEELSNYILKGVTEGIAYDILKVKFGIPCSKDMYYDLYRKFFWLLSEARM